MSSRAANLIIVGGGLSGCLTALALRTRRPDISFLLLETEGSFGGNHTWSFFDSDLKHDDRWLVDLLDPHRWGEHEVHFPRRRRTLGFGYNSISSTGLHNAMCKTLLPDQYRLKASVTEITPHGVTLKDGERIECAGVIDARGPASFSGVELAWQKFVGRRYHCEKPHGQRRALLMDALVDQTYGYRFVYALPFDEQNILVEDTYYSDRPSVDRPMLRRRLDDYMEQVGWNPASVEAEEMGILPIVLDGDIAAFWPEDEPSLPRLGLRGGFFHPTTGYSLPDAVANATLLVRQSDFRTGPLHALFSSRARSLWGRRAYYRMLNRMLFRAAAPTKRYRIFEHFYRLPEPVIMRFYAGETTRLDKVRILTGRPPVSMSKAIKAARARAA